MTFPHPVEFNPDFRLEPFLFISIMGKTLALGAPMWRELNREMTLLAT
jgi:hypothetical protein